MCICIIYIHFENTYASSFNSKTKRIREWRKSEREIYIHTCMWNLEKRYRWVQLQDRNKDADIENRCTDTVGEREGGMSWERSIDIYTLPRVKQIASGKMLYSTGSSAWALWWPRGVRWGEGREARRGGCMYTYLDSLRSIAETNTTLQSNYISIFKKDYGNHIRQSW